MNAAKVYRMNRPRQKAQDPLNLQSLPLIEVPRDGWPAIEAALRSDRKRRSGVRHAGLALAAAASVTLAIGLVLQKPAPVPLEQLPSPALSQDQPSAQQASNTASGEFRQVPEETLETMIALSQQLERRLRTIRHGYGALPAGAIVYQIELEDLVAQVDEELSNRPDSLALWNQRVNLLMDLEQLYKNRLRREYRQMASS